MSDDLLTRARELLRTYDLESAGELADMLGEMVVAHERMAKIVETANSTIANFALIAEAAEARLRQLASAEPVRCPLCQYQNGHRIGCDNNPVDIALRLIPRPSMESNNG